MKLFNATIHKKKTSIHAQPETEKILLPVEAIGALKFHNVSVYTLILKKSWQLDVPYEIDRIEATLQVHQFSKLDIEVV